VQVTKTSVVDASYTQRYFDTVNMQPFDEENAYCFAHVGPFIGNLFASDQ